MWLGQGRHFRSFPVRAGQLINYVGFVPTDDPDVLRQEFAGCDPRIQELLSEVQVTFRWALEPLPVWTTERLSQLGDAAHPMLPHLGQGANRSIEDRTALATILGRADRARPPRFAGLRKAPPRARGAGQRGAHENGSRDHLRFKR
jgi:salicylate hydroxylase